MRTHLTPYQATLLGAWEEVHKKSQLTFWILLALADKPRHMAAIKAFIAKESNNTITADDKSLYRALRRFHAGQIVTFMAKPTKSGPDIKEYQLTPDGIAVLTAFARTHITGIYFKESMKQRIIALTNDSLEGSL